MSEMERLGKSAVYVPGNHEYYGERFSILEEMRRAARWPRLRVLDMDEVVLKEVRFLGATLWTDYLAFGRARRPEAMDKAARFLSDHQLINRPYGFTPRDALERHERARTWLEAKLAAKWNGSTVVVTHHAPSMLGTQAKFHEAHLTAAFVSDLRELIRTYSPTLWVHGHTHHCVQYTVGHTRLVSNQRGYPHQPATGQFDPGALIDV